MQRITENSHARSMADELMREKPRLRPPARKQADCMLPDRTLPLKKTPRVWGREHGRTKGLCVCCAGMAQLRCNLTIIAEEAYKVTRLVADVQHLA